MATQLRDGAGKRRPHKRARYICVCSEQSASRKMRVSIRHVPNYDLAPDAKRLAAIVAYEANGQKESTHPTFLLNLLRRTAAHGVLYYNQQAIPAVPAVLSPKKEANAYGDRDLLL